MQTNFSITLTEIIRLNYKGDKVKFSKLCKVSYTTIYRLCNGETEPSMEKLETICGIVHRLDRRNLLLAAARDRIPVKYQQDVYGDADASSEIIRAKLPKDLAAVIRYLESSALTDPQTAEYLRRIGTWVGIIEDSEHIPRAAEEKKSYHDEQAG